MNAVIQQVEDQQLIEPLEDVLEEGEDVMEETLKVLSKLFAHFGE